MVEKTTTLYGNVWKSDLVEIWFELASQLDLNCSDNVKKLLVELRYKTKDNLIKYSRPCKIMPPRYFFVGGHFFMFRFQLS